jgi:hypothetical protein
LLEKEVPENSLHTENTFNLRYMHLEICVEAGSNLLFPPKKERKKKNIMY